MLAGIIVSICFWSRLARRDDRLIFIYVAALLGAFLGAKVVYILAEGWMHFGAPGRLAATRHGQINPRRAVGRLPRRGNRQNACWVILEPQGIGLRSSRRWESFWGRIGCLFARLLPGAGRAKPSWFYFEGQHRHRAPGPAVPVEILFKRDCPSRFFFLFCEEKHRLDGQHFHLYLIGYGRVSFLRMNFFATRRA